MYDLVSCRSLEKRLEELGLPNLPKQGQEGMSGGNTREGGEPLS